MRTEQLRLEECCVVAYRITSSGAEFCLLTPRAENRWEFPKLQLQPSARPNPDDLNQAAKSAGLRGAIIGSEPLGSYVASRGNQTRSMIGYLLRVEAADDPWPQQESHRRLWCLPEEARLRIRRKPLRRFIDLALHAMPEDASRSREQRRGA